jgi:hypothetical protein
LYIIRPVYQHARIKVKRDGRIYFGDLKFAKHSFLIQEHHVQAQEYLLFGLPLTLISDGILRLDKSVINSLPFLIMRQATAPGGTL